MFVTIIICDFNTRSNNWCSKDKTTYEGKNIESLTSQSEFKQVISDPTYLLESVSSCIDLIITPQPNLVINLGVHSAPHPNCNHQIIHAKFNLKVFYPPPYERVVWHYQDENNDVIQRSISHNSTGKEHFLTRVLIRKFQFLRKLFLIHDKFYSP